MSELANRVRDLERERDSYRKLYGQALDCVDAVFQDGFGNKPMLPDFLGLGDDKFEGVKKLAAAYIAAREELVRMKRGK